MLPNLHLWPGPFLFPMDEPAWSLFYELLANIAFAALLRKKLAGSWTMILSALLASVLLSLWAFKGHRLDVGWSNDWHHIAMGIARVTLSFSTGVLMLRLFHRTGRPLLTPILQRVIPIALAIALIFLLTSPIRALQTSGFQIFTIILLFPAVVYVGSLITTPASWTRLCVFLGNISYPVYLLQGVLFAMLYKPHIMDFAKLHPHAVFASFLVLLTAPLPFHVHPLRRPHPKPPHPLVQRLGFNARSICPPTLNNETHATVPAREDPQSGEPAQ